MRLLVTGGAGFIGSHFVRRQITGNSSWEKIVVLDALTYAGNLNNLADCQSDPRFEFIHGNILDRPLVESIMSRVDLVVHFAAESHVDRSIANPHQFVETNVLGTHVLLKAALDNSVKTFVHVSTDEVYGSIEAGSWPESDPINPNSPYSASKASSDLLAMSYFRTYGMDVRITRCGNNYGPYQFPEKIIPLFITNLMAGLKIPMYGDGSNIRDWIHVEDHCAGIELVATKGAAGNIYNIGGGMEITNLELTEIILQKMGKSSDSIEKVTDRKGHDFRYSVDSTKIRTQLGYAPAFDFQSGLSSTISWYQENESWWQPLKSKKD